ncbi:MAG: P1 family peptidase [Acidimicrobiia bacterium]|nr:P1 family peptidase [Acidimicrobiia bacterium]
MARARPRDLGVAIGTLPAGAANAITDVPGVRVGHTTVWSDGPGGVVRSGVTAVLPDALPSLFERPVPAGAAVLNGAGELTGSLQIAEWGLLEAPVMLTSTMAVGRAYDAAVLAMIDASPRVGTDDVVIPVVGECDDSYLSDARSMGVTVADARAAIDCAVPGVIASGAIGAGTGMVAFGVKGGVGTASRLLDGTGWTVGVLALVNFGEPARLVIDGCPVGRALATNGTDGAVGAPAGSCIVVIATDAPLDGRACERLARRAGLGLARVGSTAHHGSGEIFVAIATGLRRERDGDETAGGLVGPALDPLFGAVVDATEEAVIDSLFVADTVVGRAGRRVDGLPVEEVLALLRSGGPRLRSG